MATIKEYLDYAELAQAAYGNFTVGVPSIKELKNKKRSNFSPTQAKKFAERYRVLAIADSASTGFDAVLFEDKSGKKILSIRGTEPKSPEDYGDDVTLYNAQVPEQFNSLSIKPTFFSPQKKVTKKALQTVKELTGCKYLKSFSNLSKTQKLISFKQFDFINDKFQKDFNSLKFGSYSQGIVSYGCENNIISFKKAA